jgi:predicted RNA-binding protein with PIN domain
VKRILIVDGYNLILGASGGRNLLPGELAQQRRVLENFLSLYGKQESIRPVVIYDGQRMPGGHTGLRQEDDLEIIFTEPPSIADDLIFERAGRHLRDGQAVQVVTSDGGLGASVVATGAQVILAETFSAELARLMPGKVLRTGEAQVMPDVDEHFLALHQLELQKSAAQALQSAPLRGSQQPAPADERLGQAAERERRQEKGHRKQQRRLQTRSKGAGRRRRR